MRGIPRLLTRGCLAALVTLCLTQCAEQAPTALETIRARGELRVATLNSPTSWYMGAHGPEGLEFELAKAFAARLGVKLTVYPVANESALLKEMQNHQVDIVAAHLAYGSRWLNDALPTRPYAQVPQLVVVDRSHGRPRSLEALAGKSIVVAAGSPQVTLLTKLKAAGHPELSWTELRDGDPLTEVQAGRADVAIVDATEFAFSRHSYPALTAGFELPETRPAQWLVQSGATDLRGAVNSFFDDLAATERLPGILAKTNGGTRKFNFQSARELLSHITRRLPGLQHLFQSASEQTGIDWRLLAAIGYQESQWNPDAVSPNGAGGIMMLMPDTADALGVEDRSDPQQNIIAGARYFQQVHDMVPERIPEPDRTWLALAAYNVGFGHLEDARIITQMNGGNPDLWSDVREHLPLLSEEPWYQQTKRGYARGAEPVRFVERVQQFLSVLEWRSAAAPSAAAAAARALTDSLAPGTRG